MAGKWITVVVISLYRYILRPLLGPGGNCRYVPSCSEYALGAIAEFGIVRGSCLALRRLFACRPGGGMGWDPVRRSGQHTEGEVHAGRPLS